MADDGKHSMSAKVGVPLLAVAAVIAAIAGAITGAIFLVVFAIVGFLLAIVGAIWASRKVKKRTTGASSTSSPRRSETYR